MIKTIQLLLGVKTQGEETSGFSVRGGIGLISSRLTIEGPIVKNRASFMISGRRTYADIFLKLTDQFKDNVLYFYDLNAKLNFQINDKHRIYISGYTGKDVLGLSGAFGLDWGNQTVTARWNYIVSSKLFLNTSFIYSQYNNRTTIQGG
ncbi:MAG TPA: hypothetical protein PLI77_04540 [Bacteroidales bacterium]|nr:hypothetical protein [Bacteroidales bacterium]